MIYITSDHRGFQLKKHLLGYLKNELKIQAEDLGPKEHNPNDDASDFAVRLSKEVVKNPANLGILICWTGHSMCISANKIKGIRAIAGYSIEGAEFGRKHNDANVICLASKYLSDDHAGAIIKKFLETKFDNDERLVRRKKKIEELETL